MSNRKDYFFRQKVSEAELDDGFNDLEVADRQMMIDLGLIGVLQNAVVTEKSGTPDLTVDISGSASIHDKLGQRIGFGPLQNIDVSVDENSNSTEPPPGNELIVSVFAKFDRVLSDPRIDGNSATVFFERAETFDFVVRQGAATATPPATPSALDVEYILLADIQRTNGQTQVLNANITPPGGTYTAISNRREEAFKLSAASWRARPRPATRPSSPSSTTTSRASAMRTTRWRWTTRAVELGTTARPTQAASPSKRSSTRSSPTW
jgi:hypothetical protein